MTFCKRQHRNNSVKTLKKTSGISFLDSWAENILSMADVRKLLRQQRDKRR